MIIKEIFMDPKRFSAMAMTYGYEKLMKRKVVDMTVWCMVKSLCHELSARVLCMVYGKIIMSRVVSSCFV